MDKKWGAGVLGMENCIFTNPSFMQHTHFFPGIIGSFRAAGISKPEVISDSYDHNQQP
jgi:hypothetical protein